MQDSKVYRITRSIPKVNDAGRFLQTDPRETRILRIYGSNGVGKTSFVKEQLPLWVSPDDVVLYFDEWSKITNYSEFVPFILRKLRLFDTSISVRLRELADRLAKIEGGTLLDYLPHGFHSEDAGTQLARILVESLSSISTIWFVLDHAAVKNPFIAEWIIQHLLKIGPPFGVRILLIDDDSELHRSFPIVPQFQLEIPSFSASELDTFIRTGGEYGAPKSSLNMQDIADWTDSKAIWLQWILRCLYSGDRTPLLYGPHGRLVLSAFSDNRTANALSLLALCRWYDGKIVGDISTKAAIGGEKLCFLDKVFTEHWANGLMRLHGSIAEHIAREIDLNLAPYSVRDYHILLRDIFAGGIDRIEQLRSLSENGPSLNSVYGIAFHAVRGLSNAEAEQALCRSLLNVAVVKPLELDKLSQVVLDQQQRTVIDSIHSNLLARDWKSMISSWSSLSGLFTFDDQAFGARYYSVLALLHYLNNDNKRAKEALHHAYGLNASDALAHLCDGFIFLDLSNEVEAVRVFDRVLYLEPRLIHGYMGRGDAYFALKQYQRALDNYQAVIDLDASFVQALINNAIVHQKLGNLASATAALQQAYELAPNETMNYVGLAMKAVASIGNPN